MIKYLANGQEVVVIQKLDDGYLVSCLYEYRGGDDYADDDNPRIVAEVFDKPPRAICDKQIIALRFEIETLETRRAELRRETDSAARDEKNVTDRLKRVKCLQRIEDFIGGKITHYAVIPSWGMPRVLALTDTTAEYSRNKFKLLQLFGETNGNLEWNLNVYADGSGSNQTVMPATSHEEAVAFIQAHITDKALASADKPREDVIKAAEAFQVALDPQYIAAYRNKQTEIEQQNLAECEKKSAAIKARIEDLNTET